MAIDLKRTNASWEREQALASTATIAEEGQLLIRSFNTSTGNEELRESPGSTSEVLIGFSKLDTISPKTTRVYTEEAEVPSTADGDGDYEVELGHENVTSDLEANGDVAVYDVTNSTWLSVGASISDGVFVLLGDNQTLEFHSAQAGIEIQVYARVTMSAREQQQIYQQRHINSNAMSELTDNGNVGVITGIGQVFTDQYDVSVGDWSTGTLLTGVNGHITTQAGGTDISSYVRVISVPTVDDPYLGLEFNLPANA